MTVAELFKIVNQRERDTDSCKDGFELGQNALFHKARLQLQHSQNTLECKDAARLYVQGLPFGITRHDYSQGWDAARQEVLDLFL